MVIIDILQRFVRLLNHKHCRGESALSPLHIILSVFDRKKNLLAFFQVLGELHPVKRRLLMQHIDDHSCQSLYNCIWTVLQEAYKGNSSLDKTFLDKLQNCLHTHKSNFQTILYDGTSQKAKKEAVTQLGGGALSLILSAAIPLLMQKLFNK